MAKTPTQIPAQKPRNFVAKNQQTSGAGAHKNKKKDSDQGKRKHKQKDFETSLDESKVVQEVFGGVDGETTTSFNDDDWYEFNPSTKEIIRRYGPRDFSYQLPGKPIVLPNGNQVVRGMLAKRLGLYKKGISENNYDFYQAKLRLMLEAKLNRK